MGSTDATTANPYQPPTSPTARQVSFGRGMLCALPSSMIGFAIPYAALAVLLLVRFAFFGYSAANRDADLGELAIKALIPAIGCSIVFALAAIVNYTPARNLGFVRALLFVGLSALFGILAMVVAVLVLDLGPRSYTHDPFFSLRCAIAIIVTTVLAFLILRRVISEQNVRVDRELHVEGFGRPPSDTRNPGRPPHQMNWFAGIMGGLPARKRPTLYDPPIDEERFAAGFRFQGLTACHIPDGVH